MDVIDAASEERARAFARFEEILRVHTAAIVAFEVVAALPNAPELVAANAHLKRGMAPTVLRPDLSDYSDQVLVSMATEKANKFAVIRGSALVAVCGAFEYLVKATFVNHAALDPLAAAGLLANARLRLSVADVLGLSEIEKWFAIADRLFDQLSEAHPHMHSRVERFFLDFTYMPWGKRQLSAFKERMAKVDAKKFNEAFLVRNCLVHNGARVSTQLSRGTGKIVGKPITFASGELNAMLTSLRTLAEHMNSLYSSLLEL